MKTGKRIIAVLAAALLVLGIGVPAAAVKADDDTVYEFDIDFPNPETASAYKALVDWAAYLDEKSEGRIKMNIYSGGALGALPDYAEDEKMQYAVSGVFKGYYNQLTDLAEEYYDYLSVEIKDDEDVV